MPKWIAAPVLLFALAACQDAPLGMVHTHPYGAGDKLTHCEMETLPGVGSFVVSYGNNPSAADYDSMHALRSMPGAENFSGIVMDKEKITAYDGSNDPEGQLQIDRCGY
jgi:hypothetical protein